MLRGYGEVDGWVIDVDDDRTHGDTSEVEYGIDSS
jgi:hypothetical protein